MPHVARALFLSCDFADVAIARIQETANTKVTAAQRATSNLDEMFVRINKFSIFKMLVWHLNYAFDMAGLRYVGEFPMSQS